MTFSVATFPPAPMTFFPSGPTTCWIRWNDRMTVPTAGYNSPPTSAMPTGPRKPVTISQFGTFGRSMAHKMRAMMATKITTATTITISFSLIEVGLKNQSTVHSLRSDEHHSLHQAEAGRPGSASRRTRLRESSGHC